MLIALHHKLLAIAEMQVPELSEAICIIIITIIGIRMVADLVKTPKSKSSRIPELIVEAFLKEISFLFEKLVNAIEWIVRKIIDAIPKVYKGSNAFFKGKGMSSTFSKIAAFAVTALFIAIII